MIWWITQAQASPVLDGAVLQAAEVELERGMEMSLPDQASPYFISYEVLDGDVATCSATFGALRTMDHNPYRNLRVDVRVGDYSTDNSNFDGSFGTRDGVESRGLPQNEVLTAMRREIWMATDHAYKGATEQLAAKNASREGAERTFAPDLIALQDPLVTERNQRPDADGEGIKEIALTLSKALAANPDHEEATAVARDWQGMRMLVTSEGSRAWIPTGFTVVRVQGARRTQDGAEVRNARWWVAKRPELLPPLAEMEQEVRDLEAWLDQMETAPVEEDYLGPVLFEAPAAVELFRQLVAPQIAGTPPEEVGRDAFGDGEGAPPTARIGRRLLPEGWGVVDDPTADPEAAGGYTHDFEGVPAQRVEAVEDGIVKRLLMSRIPREKGDTSTGHGRSLGNARRSAIPAQVFVKPKRQLSKTKLQNRAIRMARQAGLDYVLVIRRLEPPAMTEDFRVAFTGEGPLPGLTAPFEAYRLYADGRTEPVRGLGFVGVDRRALRDIVASGRMSDPVHLMDGTPDSGRFNIGTVGGLPVTWSAPPVLISEMELRGSSAKEPRIIPPPRVAEN